MHLPAVGDLIDGGKYRIDERIGAGGMGVVYAATHVTLRKRRAIKWLLPKLARDDRAVQRFLDEARIAARIDHGNVVSPIDVSDDTGAPYIVMELLRGQSLADYLEEGLLPFEKVGRIFMPVLQGVAAAHDQRIVHRDLKPANIFLAEWSGEGRIPKILDFGIAKLLDGAQTSGMHALGGLTDQGALLGTIQYMSPEQLKDSSSVGPQADVYALGVILYRMLSGKMPFEGNLLDLALRIREGRPTPLSQHVPELPQGLEAVVMRALGTSLADRYSDVRSFANALKPFFPGHALDFSPDLRKSRPLPISELPPGQDGAEALAHAATQLALPAPPRLPGAEPFAEDAALSSSDRSATAAARENSTFHPVASQAPGRRPRRPTVLIAGLGALALVAVAAIALFGEGASAPPPAGGAANAAPSKSSEPEPPSPPDVVGALAQAQAPAAAAQAQPDAGAPAEPLVQDDSDGWTTPPIEAASPPPLAPTDTTRPGSAATRPARPAKTASTKPADAKPAQATGPSRLDLLLGVGTDSSNKAPKKEDKSSLLNTLLGSD
ncbi:MAG: protein kinase [Myxococcales bacterium]|nr:protein kinase [Myxococcales bacterium]